MSSCISKVLLVTWQRLRNDFTPTVHGNRVTIIRPYGPDKVNCSQLLLNNIDVPAPFKYVISRSLFSHNISALDDAIQLINIETARDLIQNFPENEEFPHFLNGARSLLAKAWVIISSTVLIFAAC